MTLLEPITKSDVRADEANFEIEEMFFSRTDERGVIAAGNDVFQRISGYTWEELIGAPHKLIRHPDMPKGVFYLFWDRIKAGLPTGAYVKNRSKDGSYYWVFAAISPIEGGYLSIRIKPSSEIFTKIPDLYAELLSEEQEGGNSPEQSAALLLEKLGEHGFASYDDFGAQAICKEVIERDTALARKRDTRLDMLEKTLPFLSKLMESQQELLTAFAGIKGIPSNMRIVASRLEPAGGPISAISQNYRLMADEVTGEIDALQKTMEGNGGRSVARRVLDTLFVVATSRLMRETGELFKEQMQASDEKASLETEARQLNQLVEKYRVTASEELGKVCAELERLGRSVKDLRQLVTGLDSIRVLCRVEAGRLGSGSAALLPVIDQLDRSHVKIDATLEKIHDLSDRVVDHAKLALPRGNSSMI